MFGAPPNGSTFFSFSGPTIAVELFLDLILNTDPLRPLFYLNEIIYSKKILFFKKNLNEWIWQENPVLHISIAKFKQKLNFQPKKKRNEWRYR